MRHSYAFGLLLALGGCATQQSAVDRSTMGAMDEKQARDVIARYEQRHQIRAASASDPLRNPKSMDDVTEALKLDRIDLFPEATAFAGKQQGPAPLAMRAQIELAWGEAQEILADLLGNASQRLRVEKRDLAHRASAGAKMSPEEEKELASLKEIVADLEGIEVALNKVATTHIDTGVQLAKQVIDEAPKDYVGYRVAADYYRMRSDWAGFDEMVKLLEQTNPQSTGLVFLRGTEALNRHGDRAKAAELFRECLRRDPKFARAQVQLVLMQLYVTEAWDELLKLEAISPNHQLVQWLKPIVQSARERVIARERRRAQQNRDRAEDAAVRGATNKLP